MHQKDAIGFFSVPVAASVICLGARYITKISVLKALAHLVAPTFLTPIA